MLTMARGEEEGKGRRRWLSRGGLWKCESADEEESLCTLAG